MLRQRVITAVLLAPLAIAGVLWLPTHWLALGLAVVFLAGLWEWTRLIGLTALPMRAALLALNAALMAGLWWSREHGSLRVAVVTGVVWWLVAMLWLRHHAFGAGPRKRFLGLKAVAGALVVVPAWAAAVSLHALPGHGPGWMLFAVMLIWCADTAAYFTGRHFGGAKLAPDISPGKTRAGVYGALAGSAIYAAIGGLLLGQSRVALMLLVGCSLVVVLFSIVGDLFESLIKRQSNHKDSGSVLPGHGGVFDRLDSLFAALPVFALGQWLLGFR